MIRPAPVLPRLHLYIFFATREDKNEGERTTPFANPLIALFV